MIFLSNMKKIKPTTPGQRNTVLTDYSVLTGKASVKSLLAPLKRSFGRSRGRITVRHKGGGEKRRYRIIDFKLDKLDVIGTIASIEYDPNRTSFISLIKYTDGDRRYIIMPDGAVLNDKVLTSAQKLPLKTGNRMPLKYILVGTFVHNIELVPGRGAMLARSAGSYAKVLAHDGKYTHVEMPSSEVRKILGEAYASIGTVSNATHREESLGKAGRTRHRGIRPTVRGVAMNPVDHPHGGGEGRSPIGMPYPKTPWGKHALGVKTRRRKKYSRVFIVSRRKKKNKK